MHITTYILDLDIILQISHYVNYCWLQLRLTSKMSVHLRLLYNALSYSFEPYTHSLFIIFHNPYFFIKLYPLILLLLQLSASYFKIVWRAFDSVHFLLLHFGPVYLFRWELLDVLGKRRFTIFWNFILKLMDKVSLNLIVFFEKVFIGKCALVLSFASLVAAWDLIMEYLLEVIIIEVNWRLDNISFEPQRISVYLGWLNSF